MASFNFRGASRNASAFISQALSGARPGSGVPQPAFRPPNEENLNSVLNEFMLQVTDDSEPVNTHLAYMAKIKEWWEFCEYQYPNDPYKYNLSAEKIYRFFFFLTFQEQKKRGGKRSNASAGPAFDSAAYEAVMSHFKDITPGQTVFDFAQPKNPISHSSFTTYKAVIRKIYHVQLARGAIGLHWDQLWQNNTNQLFKHVKGRKADVDKANFAEKLSSEFAPFLLVERYNDIEAELWNDSNVPCWRNVCANLRHRYCLLYLTSGILRCESLHRAELSDFLCFKLNRADKDHHPMLLMINQIPKGKTNKGRILYGRATRHKDVRLCPVGACAMYLTARFEVTREFDSFSIDDWMDNSKWFDRKLLVDVCGNDMTVEMKNDGYSKHIKKVLQKLKLISDVLCHLGRKLGTKILELCEEETEELKKMGQWNPSVFDAAYSSKLPLGAIRKIAGFTSSSKIYFNTRTTIEPPNKLLYNTPMGRWCYDALDGVIEASSKLENEKQTAIHFLKFICEANKVFLQDMAALDVLLGEERSNHPLFSLSVFSMPQWTVSTLLSAATLSCCYYLVLLTRIHCFVLLDI